LEVSELKIKSKEIEKLKETIGAGISYIRKKLGLSQQALSEVVNLSRVHLSYIETGKHLPSAEAILILRTKFGVDLNALVDGKKKLFTTREGIPEDDADVDEIFLYYFRNSEIFRYEMLQTMKKFMMMEKEVVLKEISMNKTKQPGV